jgi:hypothetical protein
MATDALLDRGEDWTERLRAAATAYQRLVVVPSESESSMYGSIPTAYWSSCKPIPKKKADFRGFCRAL